MEHRGQLLPDGMDAPDYLGPMRIDGGVSGKRSTTRGAFTGYTLYLWGRTVADRPSGPALLDPSTGQWFVLRQVAIQPDGIDAYLLSVHGAEGWTPTAIRHLTCRGADRQRLWHGQDILDDVVLARVGKPGTFESADEFLRIVGEAVRALRTQRRNPSTAAVQRHLRTQFQMDKGQFTRTYQGFGWGVWQDFLSAVE